MNKQKTILVSAQNLAKSYNLNNEVITIFEDLSLDIYTGSHIAIMGNSGSGKSTLLTLLAALDKPDSGKILFNDKDITNFSEDQIAHLRRTDFGFVFQSFHLIPSLTALENVMFPLELIDTPSDKAREKAMEMLKKVKIDHRANNLPHQLSGGERQRTAIARALIHNPKIIFADEPTGNLDEENSEQVLELLLQLRKEFGTTLVIVTHEMDIAKKADQILFLEHGQINVHTS